MEWMPSWSWILTSTSGWSFILQREEIFYQNTKTFPSAASFSLFQKCSWQCYNFQQHFFSGAQGAVECSAKIIGPTLVWRELQFMELLLGIWCNVFCQSQLDFACELYPSLFLVVPALLEGFLKFYLLLNTQPLLTDLYFCQSLMGMLEEPHQTQ